MSLELVDPHNLPSIYRFLENSKFSFSKGSKKVPKAAGDERCEVGW